MADGKWIEKLKPAMPLTEAAEHVLTARLEVVREYLPRAMRHAREDPEIVHQLRVGTRRADAAFRIFRACLPGRIYRSGRTRLRGIRRAAGAARDWDVFLLALHQRQDATTTDAAEQPGLDFLLAYAIGQRDAAQPALEQVENDQAESFDDMIALVQEEIRPSPDNPSSTLKELARPMILQRLDALDAAASGNLKDYEQLHQVRIAGKRLRYAMEVLANCFDRPFREELYPRIEQMQEILGRANDSHVASVRISGIREQTRSWKATTERIKPGLEKLLRVHQRRLPQERRRFLEWWEQWKQLRAETLIEKLLL